MNDETDLAGGYAVFENITENAWTCYEKLLLSGRMPDKLPAFFGEENAARYLDYKNGGKLRRISRRTAERTACLPI